MEQAGEIPLNVVPALYVLTTLAVAGADIWTACTFGPGAKARRDPDITIDQRRTRRPHHQALRALGNRLVGILHGCLRHHTRYDEHTLPVTTVAPSGLDDDLRLWDVYRALSSSVTSVTIFFASPNSIEVVSAKNNGLSIPA
ncbi:hypothetical protein FXW78_33550 [Rhodococcus opacus]|nr:hypothetical protein [Rhodococcus opacus]